LTEHRELKIPPNNQSLILAGEPGGSRGVPLGVPDSLLGQASRLVAGGAALKRVTILASRPDATVVVQADFYSRNDGPPVDPRLGNPGGLGDPSNGAPAVGAANSVTRSHSATLGGPATLGRSVTLSSYFNPIELYTRTQRGFDHSTRAALLDVLA
jgi:hypothetical protein